MPFGKEIKRLRLESGYSVQKLADKIGVKAERWRKWEENDQTPREDDRLHNHYFYNQYDNVVDLKWINDSDLDSEIKEEVEQALKKAFQ